MNEKFLFNLKNILSEDEFNCYINSLNLPAKKSFRINTYKFKNTYSNDTLSHNNTLQEITKLSYAKDVVIDTLYHLNSDEKIGNTWFHKAGLVYVQEPSSTMAVESLKRIKNFTGAKVMDVCASPGGKTSQLSEMVGENGFVLSNEKNNKRVQILRSNIERLGYINVAVSSCDSQILSKNLVGVFDAVLVDAPCSGEGMFRKDINAQKEWSENEVKRNANLQLEILTNASKCVKSGGYLVYSTCTFNTLENEQVVLNFLRQNSEFEICEIDKDIQNISKEGIVLENYTSLKKARRFYPFDDFGEGQFVCIMKNILPEKNFKTNYKPNINSKQNAQKVLNFLNENFDIENINLTQVGEQYFLYSNNCPLLTNIPLLTNGVAVGEVQNNVFKPHHNLFTAFGAYCKNKVILKLNDERINKFFKGEQIEAACMDGYCAICVQGFPIGFGKCKNNIINNHYPKGLR